jgi:hypothetical protein
MFGIAYSFTQVGIMLPPVAILLIWVFIHEHR